jgi:hypothetical protein
MVRGELAVSAAYCSGHDPEAEKELLTLFVESLRRTTLVQQFQTGREPFGAIFSLHQRSLHVVVPYPNPKVTDEDQEVVDEFANHLAATFLCG